MPSRYSILRLLREAARGHRGWEPAWRDAAPKPHYDVIIVGPAGRLSFRFATSPGTGWTPFSLKLAAGAGWRRNWNAPATQEQIRRVLADATSLEIRGEYHTGPDHGALDNVVIKGGG